MLKPLYVWQPEDIHFMSVTDLKNNFLSLLCFYFVYHKTFEFSTTNGSVKTVTGFLYNY